MLKTMSTLREYLQYTEDALSAGRIEEALEHCQYVLSHFPHSLEAHRLLGEIYLAQNRLAEAQQTFDWVLTNDPENVLAYCNRALTSERLGDVETALDCYQQAYELSRGNSQIRQEFNKLSARSGQPGFMLSRAGLARLYMRGDLLFQAIQEWEAVLAATPDRLDARTGLLEACWRDGDFERAEQIATSLLEEIPGCLKALLLLAHMTFPHNPARARELLQRAEALDPEMTMARELFSDLLTASSNDPFLTLVRKDAVLMPPPGRPAAPAAESTLSRPSPTLAEAQEAASDESEPIFGWTTPDPYPLALTTTPAPSPTPAPPSSMASQPPEAPVPSSSEAYHSSSPSWSLSGSDFSFGEQGPSWEEQPAWPPAPAAGSEEDLGLPASQSSTHPAWLDALDSTLYRQPSGSLATPASSPEPAASAAEGAAAAATPELESLDLSPHKEEAAALPEIAWSQPPTAKEESPAERQEAEEEIFPFMQEGADPEEGWPEWLKSLGAETMEESAEEPPASSLSSSGSRGAVWGEPEEVQEPKQEREAAWPADQGAQDSPVTPVSAEVDGYARLERGWPGEPAAHPTEDYIASEPAYSAPATWDELTGEEFSAPPGKPAWLEQLQASHSAFEEQEAAVGPLWPPSAPTDSSSTGTPPTPPAASIWGEESPAPSAPAPATPAASPQSSSHPEAGIPWLEQLAGWSTGPEVAAGSSTSNPSSPIHESQITRPEPEPAPAPSAQSQELPASSWLAELAAGAGQRPAEQSRPPAAAEQRLLTTLEDLEQQLYAQGFVPLQPGELAAFAQQGQGTPPSPAVPEQPQPPRTAYAPQQQPAFSPGPTPPSELEETVRAPLGQPPLQPPRYEEPRHAPEPLWPGPGSNPSLAQGPAQGPSLPSYRPDALLEDELETTMKRPVFRLQPAQNRPSAPGGRPSSPAPRPASRETPGPGPSGPSVGTGRSSEGGEANYKEHLIRGYQYQLAGAYDEAMQEYRIVIRNQPELLGEVISNTRALLKLAPKYAPGYRVLGDAYMRQGEYLQAMEAYNKALTMTRRARGQGASS
ncbi:tetratricopeptide repeat protein [Thermogemmatispora onikobensis]|uniref:tetratricopeptide repeat protein n=1 Tax=Thermogemmatispora onikobensis TaxID=732234 RepID=UPI000852A7D1|nr:tetratricopeptide repeat protein [Thermogemmatispora onikobensis]